MPINLLRRSESTAKLTAAEHDANLAAIEAAIAALEDASSIGEGAITRAKLEAGVVASLDRADGAVARSQGYAYRNASAIPSGTEIDLSLGERPLWVHHPEGMQAEYAVVLRGSTSPHIFEGRRQRIMREAWGPGPIRIDLPDQGVNGDSFWIYGQSEQITLEYMDGFWYAASSHLRGVQGQVIHPNTITLDRIVKGTVDTFLGYDANGDLVEKPAPAGGGTSGDATSIDGVPVNLAGMAEGQLIKLVSGVLVPANDLVGSGGSTNVPIMVGSPYGAVAGDSSANGGANAAAFGANLGTNGALVTPGVYRLNTCQINGHLILMKGAILRPNSGQTVTWGSGATVLSAGHMFMDGSAGGGFAQCQRLGGELNAAWFSGSELGAMLNNARAWGGRHLHVPTRSDNWTLSTTVFVHRDMTITGDSAGNLDDGGQMIFCRTNKKACFEVLGGTHGRGLMINVDFRNLSFFGQSTTTSACLFFLSGNDAVGHCYQIHFDRVAAWGYWGFAILYECSAEECFIRDCNFRMFGPGDYGSTNCPRRGCVVFTQWHCATELTSGQGIANSNIGGRSHSAWSIHGGVFWMSGGMPGAGCIVLLNQSWDMTLEPGYCPNGNSDGGCFILDDRGRADGGADIYGIRIAQQHRIEGSAPFLRVRWSKSWSIRCMVIMYGSHWVDAPVVVGETGNEWLSGFQIDNHYYIPHHSHTDVLFQGIAQITNSVVMHRHKPMRWLTAGGADKFPSGLPGSHASHGSHADLTGSTFDMNLKIGSGALVNGRTMITGSETG